jgi:centrosomal protein CEP89
LKNHNAKLINENTSLKKEKVILLENYNSLLENVEESAKEDNNKVKYLESSNVEMKNDLKMLKVLVFRLNKHIEYYQEILNEKEIKFETPMSIANEDESSATTWTIHTNILSPLMDSYEERIKEKNEIIKSYETELSQFTTKIKKVFEENENLHEQFEALSRNTEVWRAEKQRLISQCEILQKKASIHAKRADLAKEKLYEVLKVYEQKNQSQAIDIERLQEAYNRTKGEIASLKSLQKTPEIVNQQLEEYQNFLSDLRNQFETEKNQLIEDKRNLDAINSQLRNDVSELQTLLEKQKLCNE